MKSLVEYSYKFKGYNKCLFYSKYNINFKTYYKNLKKNPVC